MPLRAVQFRGWILAASAALALPCGLPAHADELSGDFQTADLGSSFANGRSSLIPCEFFLDGILIPIPTPDKKQAFLLFDTGANEPMLSAAFADKMRIRGTTNFTAAGIGEGVAEGSITTGITFSLPGITFRHARWAILPNVPLDAEYGRPVVGVLGMDLLTDFVIRIDYVRHTIEFLKSGTFQPPGRFVELPLRMGERGPMVPATVRSEGGSATGQFLLDTGDNGALELSRPFQDANPGLKFTPFAQNGESGVGGDMVNEEAVCPALSLGGIAVARSLVNLAQTVAGGPGIDGSIGNEIWRRFDVILDLPQQKLCLRRNAQFSDPFHYVSAGMNLLASGEHYETLTIHEILPGS
ncbi:MAG TPA: aspartyl protease family protein, partial [Candidatus Methylacidiphilales bacterium]|nr:aspartyl protease family protein [Candidatus Methylacidiphilales bacterium]